MEENKMTMQQGAAELAREVRNAEEAGLRLVVVPTDAARLAVDYLTLLENASRAQRTDLSECNFDAPVAAATEQARQDIRDAHRYRWLRSNNIVTNVRFHFASGESPYLYAEELDKAIDHNMGYDPLATPADAGAGLTEADILAALASVTHEPPKRLPPGWLKFARAIEREVMLNMLKAADSRIDIAAEQRAPAPVTAEPVAWIRKTDITELTDSEPETNGWTPLYATPAPADRDAIRDQALAPQVIDLGRGIVLRRAECGSGVQGWVWHDKSAGLQRELNAHEANWIDSTIRAAKSSTWPASRHAVTDAQDKSMERAADAKGDAA